MTPQDLDASHKLIAVFILYSFFSENTKLNVIYMSRHGRRFPNASSLVHYCHFISYLFPVNYVYFPL